MQNFCCIYKKPHIEKATLIIKYRIEKSHTIKSHSLKKATKILFFQFNLKNIGSKNISSKVDISSRRHSPHIKYRIEKSHTIKSHSLKKATKILFFQFNLKNIGSKNISSKVDISSRRHSPLNFRKPQDPNTLDLVQYQEICLPPPPFPIFLKHKTKYDIIYHHNLLLLWTSILMFLDC